MYGMLGEVIAELRADDRKPALQRSEDTAFHTGDIAMQRASFRNEHGENLGERGVESGWRRQRR